MSTRSTTIIIPTLNEATRIGALVGFLSLLTEAPIWIANSPNTTDDTIHQAQLAGALVINCPEAGRAAQMNYAAQKAQTDILYFVHADTFPPHRFAQLIAASIRNGNDYGYFSYKFDSRRPLLSLNSWATRWDSLFAGGGDQTLFIRREVFLHLGGFNENLCLMEDFDLVRRAKQAGYKHELITEAATVSARKYDKNSWFRVNVVNLWVFVACHLGASQQYLVGVYRRYLK